MDTAFSGLSLIIVLGAAVALVMRLIGQPLIIGYIITGILVGPAVLDITKSPETLHLFSEIGIALLLFIIGLGLNPRILREVSRTAAIVGFSQIALVTIAGWIAGQAAGLTNNEALFLGAGLAISSTIVVLKLLSDKKEQNRLYGKVTISVLLAQDIIAVILILITSAAGSQHTVSLTTLFSLAAKGLILGWLIYTFSYKVLSRYRRLIADNQEFLFLFAIAWGLGSAALFAKIGLSSEIGALFAGVCLASLPYAQEISARLRPLRDFFLIVFFIALGSNLTFDNLGSLTGLIIISLVIAVLLKPLVAMAAMGSLGYTKRTSFKAAITLGQVSEFSIVLILLARDKGLIGDPLVSAVIFITMVSIGVSTYMITFSDRLFAMFESSLDLFERRKTHGEPVLREKNDLILFGYQKGGHEFVKAFRQLKKPFVVIDYDPEIIDILERERINHLYGDITDIELLEEAGVPEAKLIVSTTDDVGISQYLLDYLKKNNPEAVVILQADSPKQAAKLYHEGASYVMLPHYIGSEKIGAFVRHSELRKSDFKKYREKHLKYLESEFGALDEIVEDEHPLIGKTIIKNVAKLTRSKS